ncbi:MAG: hypothetical protein AB1586_02830 [Pseudomonadota bacterium]|jgi:hypothetical protein
MGDETTKASWTVIDGGSGEQPAGERPVTEESLELVQAFIRITSAEDRRRVIDLATALARQDR